MRDVNPDFRLEAAMIEQGFGFTPENIFSKMNSTPGCLAD